MPKDKKEYINPLQRLTQLSPYASTEVPEKPSPQVATDTPVETQPEPSTQTPLETSVEANMGVSPQIDRDIPIDAQTSPKMTTEANVSIHPTLATPPQTTTPTSDPTNLDVTRYVDTEAFTQTYPSVEDMWSNLPSDVVSKHETESNAMFERTHEKISSWLDKKLKRGMYAYFRIGKRGGRKVVHVLNEAVRDVLRKHQNLASLSQELKRPIDDLLLEAIQDLVKKYQKEE